MAKAMGKKLRGFLQTSETNEYLSVLSKRLKILVTHDSILGIEQGI